VRIISVRHPLSHAIQHWIRVFHQFFFFSSRLQLPIISSSASYQNFAHLFSRVCAWRVSVVFLPNKIMRIRACCAVYQSTRALNAKKLKATEHKMA